MLPNFAKLSLDPGVKTGGWYADNIMTHHVLLDYKAGIISYEEAMKRLGEDDPFPKGGNDRQKKTWAELGMVINEVQMERDRRNRELERTRTKPASVPKPTPVNERRSAAELAKEAMAERKRRSMPAQVKPAEPPAVDSSDSFSTDGGDSPGRASARDAGARLKPILKEALDKGAANKELMNARADQSLAELSIQAKLGDFVAYVSPASPQMPKIAKITGIYTNSPPDKYYEITFVSGATRQTLGDRLYPLFLHRSRDKQEILPKALWDKFQAMEADSTANPYVFASKYKTKSNYRNNIENVCLQVFG